MRGARTLLSASSFSRLRRHFKKRARVPAFPSISWGTKFFDPRGNIEKTARKLQHWQQGEAAIFLTFPLADSLPREHLDD